MGGAGAEECCNLADLTRPADLALSWRIASVEAQGIVPWGDCCDPCACICICKLVWSVKCLAFALGASCSLSLFLFDARLFARILCCDCVKRYRYANADEIHIADIQ